MKEKTNRSNFAYLAAVAVFFLLAGPPSGVSAAVLSSDDFFAELVFNRADLTFGEAHFILKNPTDYGLELTESNLPVKFIMLKGKKIDSYELSVAINRTIVKNETLYRQECGLTENASKHCWIVVDGYSESVKYAEEWEPFQNIILPAGGSVKIRLIARWRADIGSVAIDWIPALKPNKQNTWTWWNANEIELEHKEWAWWNTSFSNRRVCTINSTVDVELANFPARCILDTQALISEGLMQADCDDVRVVKNDTTIVPYKVEACNTNRSVIWFHADAFPTGNVTIYSIYFGNSTTSALDNATGVWNNSYVSVYLFDQSLRDEKDLYNLTAIPGSTIPFQLLDSELGYGLRSFANATGKAYVNNYYVNNTGFSQFHIGRFYDFNTDGGSAPVPWSWIDALVNFENLARPRHTTNGTYESVFAPGGGSAIAVANQSSSNTSNNFEHINWDGAVVSLWLDGNETDDRAMTGALQTSGGRLMNCMRVGQHTPGVVACDSAAAGESRANMVLSHLAFANVSRPFAWLRAEARQVSYVSSPLVNVTLNAPTNQSIIGADLSYNVSFNFTATLPTHEENAVFINASLFVWWLNGTALNNSLNQTEVTNTTPNIITYVLPNGDFWWNVFACANTTGSCAFATSNRSIFTANLTNCTVGGNAAYAYNFTFRNEETNAILNGSMSATFYLRNNDSTFNRAFSFNYTNVTVATLCINPANAVTRLNSTQVYWSDYSTIFATRYYNLFNASISSTTNLVDLYLLADALAEQVVITVVDENNDPQIETIVKAQRYFPGSNSYLTVEAGITDYQGRVSMQLRPNDVYYRFIIEQNGTIVSTQTPLIIVCESGTCPPYRLTLSIATLQASELYRRLGYLSSSCTMNGSSGILTCEFNDGTGITQNASLIVSRRGAHNFTTVCYNNCSSSACAITCNLSPTSGNVYYYQLVIRSNPEVVAQADFLDFAGAAIAWGTLGLILAFLLVGTLFFAGAFSPSVAVGGAVVGVVVGYVVGILPVTLASVIGIVLIGILIAWKMRV
jgi:hypothetical protein